MLFICIAYDEDIWAKFEKSDAGYFNKRLKEEAEKRANYSLSRSNNRTTKKDMINTSKTYVQHMENEDENVNRDVFKKKRKKKSLEDDEDFKKW